MYIICIDRGVILVEKNNRIPNSKQIVKCEKGCLIITFEHQFPCNFCNFYKRNSKVDDEINGDSIKFTGPTHRLSWNLH